MRAHDSHSIITNHEPILFNEVSHSSNNALEDLEKNCRKRINIEELCMDKTKRVCSVPPSDSLPEIPPPVVDISSSQSGKRAREPSSPEKSTTDSPIAQQVKRLRIRHNALFSSLSSSHHELIPKKNMVQTQQLSKKTVPMVVEKRQPDKTVSVLSPSVPRVESPAVINQQSSVKKLRLFNVAAKQPPPSFRSKFRNFNDDDDDDEFKINFVKPKEKPSNIDVDANQSIEKEKLSRMLHCLGDGLSGTTTEYTRDTVDSQNNLENSKKKSVTFSPAVNFLGSTETSAPNSSSITSESLLKPTDIISSSNAGEKQNVIESSIQTIRNPSDKQTEKEATTVSSVITASNISAEKLNEKPAGISFVYNTPSTAVSTTVASPPKTTLPTLDPSKSLISFSPAPALKDTQASAAPTIKPTTTTGALPVLGGFSFSAPKDPRIASLSGFQSNTPATTSLAPVVNASSDSLKTTSASNPTSFQFGGSSIATTSPPSFFTTSTAAITTTTSALPAATFNFTKPSIEQKSPITESSSTLALPANNTTKLSFAFGQTNNKPETTQSSGVGFSFGSSTFSAAPLPATTGTSFSFNNAEKTAASSTQGGFSFGNSTAKIPSPTGIFGQQSNDPNTVAPSTGINMFQSSATPTTTSNSSLTGGIGSSPKGGGIFSRLGDKAPEMNTNNNNAAAGSFAFGAINKNTTTSFGLESGKQPEVKTFSFGGEKKAESVPSFGITPNNDSSKTPGLPGFSFNVQPKLPENKSTFAFGGDKQADKPSFAFGAATKTAEVKPSFSFGSNVTEQKQEAPVAFSFGGSKPQSDNKIDNHPKPNLFGANSASSANIFGAVTKQDASLPFGSTSQTSTFGHVATGTFNPSTTPVFGASSQQNPPAFGAAANTTSGAMLFGNNNPPAFNQSQSGFGQSNPSASSGTFGFNQANKNDLNVQTPQSAPATGIFSFGGSATPTNNQQPTNVFGGANTGQNVSASFSFKSPSGVTANNNASTNMFGSNQNNASAFPFNQNVTNASASFTFSPPSASVANTQSSAFNFNPAAVPQSAPAAPTGAFNFQVQQNQQQQGPMMPVANSGGMGGMFNIGVGGGQQKRPFRQATRRLK